MKIFTIFGDLVLRMFNIMGMIILEIPRFPARLRGVNTEDIKVKIDSDSLKENITKLKNDEKIRDGISKISNVELSEIVSTKKSGKAVIEHTEDQGLYTNEQKEKTVFHLQIASGAFLIISMLYVFNFLSIVIYGLLGAITAGYIIYILFYKIKFMYSVDFNAYRDFFLMYIAVGIILSFVGTNPNFVMSFSFAFLPSLSVLIFAIICVVAVFLIFRLKYHRDYTYGTVVESGNQIAHVRVNYDIRTNIKPDIYIVNNNVDAEEGDFVQLSINENIFSVKGNKPSSIIEIIKKIK